MSTHVNKPSLSLWSVLALSIVANPFLWLVILDTPSTLGWGIAASYSVLSCWLLLRSANANRPPHVPRAGYGEATWLQGHGLIPPTPHPVDSSDNC